MLELVIIAVLSVTTYLGFDGQKDRSADIMKDVSGSIYIVYDKTGRGTGWIAKAKSGKLYMVTNGHVCESAKESMNTEKNGVLSELTIRYRDPRHDICLLDAPKKAVALPLAKKVYKEKEAYAVGFPAVEFMTSQQGLVKGYEIVSMPYPLPPGQCKDLPKFEIYKRKLENGKTEEICVFHGNTVVTTIQSDSGGSGSPILNDDEEVIGMVMLTTGNISWAQGVPLDELKRVLESK